MHMGWTMLSDRLQVSRPPYLDSPECRCTQRS